MNNKIYIYFAIGIFFIGGLLGYFMFRCPNATDHTNQVIDSLNAAYNHELINNELLTAKDDSLTKVINIQDSIIDKRQKQLHWMYYIHKKQTDELEALLDTVTTDSIESIWSGYF